jgi:DNA polymerase-4
MRCIFHLDMDAFFVSVEELFDPSLKGKAVVVGGRPDQRGVVSAASYAARKFGVHSAMPLRTAYKLCPQAIFVDGHPDRYRDYSRRVRSILGRFTPLVEMASIDEAYLDMTGTERLHGPALRAAHLLHKAIGDETQLNCSIGIGTSRLVAKMCSDQAKPNGVLWVAPGNEAQYLAPFDVRKIPGVGKRTEESLHACGIRKVGDFSRLEEKFLQARFGKWGLALAGKARGEDAGGYFDSPVGFDEGVKSISHEHTYNEDTADVASIHASLAYLSEKVGRRLREAGLYARTIQIKLRYSDFSTFTRAHTLTESTNLDMEILAEARALFDRNWTKAKVRLIGVQTSGLESKAGQTSLLSQPERDRWAKALTAADVLRDKYGDSSVSLGSSVLGRFREKTHEALPDRAEVIPPGRPDRREKA